MPFLLMLANSANLYFSKENSYEQIEIRIRSNDMTDWETCEAVEHHPKKVSGVWVFRGTRVPVSALFENLKDGASCDQFLEWFPGVERWQVETVLDHEVKAMAASVDS